MSYGSDLVERRKALGLSQERLAKLARVKIPRLSLIERDMADPTPYEHTALDRFLRTREEALDRARLNEEKKRTELEVQQQIKDRDRALVRAVMHNDFTTFIDYCVRYSVPMPDDAYVFKMAVYKAALGVVTMPPEIRRNAQMHLDIIMKELES
jgi:transcriptional regulator with XRE-family HTH domain